MTSIEYLGELCPRCNGEMNWPVVDTWFCSHCNLPWPMEHRLKCWPEWFEALVKGTKAAEVRLGDRPFSVGDKLILEEWDPETEAYSGRIQTRIIAHVMRDHPGLSPMYVLLSFEAVTLEWPK